MSEPASEPALPAGGAIPVSNPSPTNEAAPGKPTTGSLNGTGSQDAATGADLVSRLSDAERQLRHLHDHWPGVVFRQRLDLSFEFVTPRIEDLTGLPVEEWQRSPTPIWKVLHEGDIEAFQSRLAQAVQGTELVIGTYRIRHFKNGRIRYVQEQRELIRNPRGEPLGYEGFWLDVTPQAVAEKRLASATWNETLLALTMDLAHDFNNIIGGIHLVSENFQSQLEPAHPFHEGLRIVQRNARQASDLIQKLVKLHCGKIGQGGYHNLNDVVGESIALIRKAIPRHMKIECRCAPESLPICADAVELRRVLVSLALNAVERMPEEGRLSFRTSRHGAYPHLEHVEGTLPRLPSVCVAVEDCGCGIPRELLPKAFDPFFIMGTGNGPGLALHSARVFTGRHRGAVSIDSREKQGTRVCVWLPEADFSEGDGNASPARPR